ncbi:coronatine-insensitive protein 1-like protein, partial [Tanacetum coccineum]
FWDNSNNPINENHFGMGGFGVNPNIPFPVQLAKYKDFKFPPKLKYFALNQTGRKYIVLPFAHLITHLGTEYVYDMGDNYNHHYSLVENCPNLEVLYTTSISDGGLEKLSKYYKNMRKLYVTSRMGYVTKKGLLALAPGCPKLDCLHINLSPITYDVMAYIGMQMKNLYELSMELGGLSDESLKNIGMCGYNLRYLSPCYVGESDATLVELSFGCLKLQNLVIKD